MTYKDAGVNPIDTQIIKDATKDLKNQNFMLNGIGDDFNSAYDFGAYIAQNGIKNPILLNTTDGVGTKLNYAIRARNFDSIGIDLVAMNVNDIATTGGTPLVLLDYIAANKFEKVVLEKLLKSIVRGCNIANISLIGGECAELNLMFKRGIYDLSASCMGTINRDDYQRLIKNYKSIKSGDLLLGIASSGFHSNGYSLITKALKNAKIDPLKYNFNNHNLIDLLLEPTIIYSDLIAQMMGRFSIKSMANITGGGLNANITRALRKFNQKSPYGAEIRIDRLDSGGVFALIKDAGKIKINEMLNTFNMGIGFALLIDENEAEAIIAYGKDRGFNIREIGKINNSGKVDFV